MFHYRSFLCYRTNTKRASNNLIIYALQNGTNGPFAHSALAVIVCLFPSIILVWLGYRLLRSAYLKSYLYSSSFHSISLDRTHFI